MNGVIYLTVRPKINTPEEWLRWCYLFDFLPISLQNNIKHIANYINTKYKDDIVIPMDVMLHPGCTTTPEKVEEIANEMYNQYSEMIERYNIDPCVRCVYAIGELDNLDTDSTHHLEKKRWWS